MPRRKSQNLLTGLLLLIPALAGLSLSFGLEPPDPKPKIAATPEEAVKLLVEAAKAGDIEKLLAQVAEPVRAQARMLVDLDAAATSFETALDQKFGKDPQAEPGGNMRSALKHLNRIEIRAKAVRGKDEVELTIWEVKKDPDTGERIVETKIIAVKEGPGWKLQYNRLLGARPQKQATRTSLDGKEVTVHVEEPDEKKETDTKGQVALKEYVEKMKATYTRLAREVKAGKYSTREDAERARQAAVQKVLAPK